MRILTIERQVVSSLFDQLGLYRTLLVLWSIVVEKCRYHPFKSLTPTKDPSESLARAHVRDALVLYRAIDRRLEDNSESVFRTVMSKGAHAFLLSNIGWIDRPSYQKMSQQARQTWLSDLIHLFPNATATIDEASSGRVAFTVTRCRYVELARIAGYPDLANVFCAGDAAFFEAQPAGVEFERLVSIASGADHCPFVLTLTENDGKTDE